MKASNKIFAALVAICLLGGSGLAYQEGGAGQNIDPFYLERLESGERAFLAGDVETAIKDLEIALFGLAGEKELRAKAYAYLGLSYYSLKNTRKAEGYLRDAENLMGMDALKPLIASEPIWSYLNKIMVELRIVEAEAGQKEEPAVPVLNLQQREESGTEARDFAENLERQIKSNPRNVNLYYELYEFYQNNGNTDATKKTLENLLKRNPDEAKGYYLLGRIQYKQRNLKEANKNFSKVFELRAKVSVDDYVLVEAVAYRILTLHLQGEREASSKMFAQWADRFDEERIRYLDLDEQDRSIFMGIAQNEATRAEIERMRSRGEGAAGGGEQGSVPEQAQNMSSQMGSESIEPSGELKTGDIVPLDQVDTAPVLKTKVDPEYPASAKAMRIEGQVTVNLLISEEGDVVEAVVLQGQAGGFNEATVKAVKQWKYEPAVKDGVKVKVWKPVTIVFRQR